MIYVGYSDILMMQFFKVLGCYDDSVRNKEYRGDSNGNLTTEIWTGLKNMLSVEWSLGTVTGISASLWVNGLFQTKLLV